MTSDERHSGFRRGAHETNVNVFIILFLYFTFTCKIWEHREAFVVSAAGFHKAAEKCAHGIQGVSNPALQIGYWGYAFMG